MSENPPSYVARADGKEVAVVVTDEGLIPGLLGLGFVSDKTSTPNRYGSILTKKVADDAEKGALFTKLQECGICFSGGREWNPAEVFEYLHEKGLTEGRYKTIVWKGPQSWVIYEEKVGQDPIIGRSPEQLLNFEEGGIANITKSKSFTAQAANTCLCHMLNKRFWAIGLIVVGVASYWFWYTSHRPMPGVEVIQSLFHDHQP